MKYIPISVFQIFVLSAPGSVLVIQRYFIFQCFLHPGKTIAHLLYFDIKALITIKLNIVKCQINLTKLSYVVCSLQVTQEIEKETLATDLVDGWLWSYGSACFRQFEVLSPF